MNRFVISFFLFVFSVAASAAPPPHPQPLTPAPQELKKFAPLNFKAAAEQEKANPPAQRSEIEEIDEPQPRPFTPHGVPINPGAQSAATIESTPSFGTGISPPPAKSFKAEYLSGTTIPPDTMGAVGTTHIVTVTNDRMRILTREGVELARMTLTSFWSGVTVKGAAVSSAFDPKVIFDRFNNRFILISSANGASINSGAMFAVSATADPTGVWYRWTVAADPSSTASAGRWIDYPSLGHNKNWIAINYNVFLYPSGYYGQYIYVLDKQAAYANTLSSINLFSGAATDCVGGSDLSCGFTMAPAITEDNTTDTEYVVEDWDNVAAQLRLSKITGTPSAPVLTVGTQFPQSSEAWRYDAPRIGTAANCGGTCSGGYMPQRQQSANLPSGSRINANDARVQNAVYRGGVLWTTHTVMLAASSQPAGTTIGGTGNPIDNHSGIFWWAIDPTNETAASTLPLQRGLIHDPTANNCHDGNGGTLTTAPCSGTTANQFGEFFAFPNISVNKANDVLIGFSRFSPLTYAASGYVIRHNGEPNNTVHDPVIFRPGQANYNIGSGSGSSRNDRWGDYSSAQTDPLDDTTFWTVQEYAGTQRNDFLAPSYAGPWETWWAQIDPRAAEPVANSNLIISEFRLRGPQGVRDEFVELYNPNARPVIVNTTDNSYGWALVFSANGSTVTSVFAVIPNGTVIPAHGHFLVVDNPDNTAGGTSALTYSLNGVPSSAVRGADSDTGWALDLADNGGIALFNTSTTANFSATTRLDSVGFSTIAAGLFKEGNGIPAITAATPTGQIAFVRNTASGVPQDTGANENDFVFLDPVVGETLGSTPKFGAAGPENLASPINLTSAVTFPGAVLDAGVTVANAPNRVRDGTAVTNGAFGTLTLRRSFLNNTGADLQRLRFRIVDMSTYLPSLGSAADLRALTSADASVSVSSGATVTVAGTTVETPPTQSNGGGINATLSVPDVALATPLRAGASINVQFTLGVQTTGLFNFCIFPEGNPALASPVSCLSGNTENTPPSITGATISVNGGTTTNNTIATVTDAQDSAGSLVVGATSVPSGITVANIVNTAGTITADVGDCATTAGTYLVTLRVTDSDGASATGTLTVNATASPPPATPTITPSGPTTFYSGGSVTLTSSSATGNQWYRNGYPIAGATNQSYLATLAGSYTVQVTTNGCSTATSAATIVTVNPYPTTTSVVSSLNPSVLGQAVTFTATVAANPSPGPATPTGTVTFFDGASQLGSAVTLNGSAQAALTTSNLAIGSHSITASYSGDSTFQNSTSATLSQAVTVSVSGSVSGLTGSGLVLRLTYGASNTTVDLPVNSGATSFLFNTVPMATGDAYGVSVLTQPSSPSQVCVVSNGSGTLATSNINNVVINCPAPGALSGSGLSVPGSVGLAETATLIVSVSPGQNPNSTGVTVTVDLSSIGGSATQAFYDDGTHGDQTAGDHIYTFHAIVPSCTALGAKSLPATIADAQSRQATTSIPLTVAQSTEGIFADGFDCN